MIDPVRSWADESIRYGAAEHLYLLGAVSVPGEEDDRVRDTLRPLAGGNRKLHWHRLSGRERTASIDALAQLDFESIIIRAPFCEMARQHRARAKCLESLALRVQGAVGCVTLERREPRSDARDLDVIHGLRAQRLIASDLNVRHGDPADEPLLWLPDLVLGAYGASLGGEPRQYNQLSDRTTMYEAVL